MWQTIVSGAVLAASLASSAAAQTLAGSEWGPVEIAGAAFEPFSETFLRFEQDGRVIGNGGCNSLRGQFVTNGNAILFGPAAMTRMACREAISKQEATFVLALQAARLFERDGVNLMLSDNEGNVVMQLRQRDPD